MNAVEIEQALSDLALQPFDGGEFPFVFLAAFGHKERALKRLRAGNNYASDVAGTTVVGERQHVAEYRLHNLRRTRMENLFHRLLGAAQIDLTIPDRFGNPVKPREWFLVPLQAIDEAVKRIVDGSIVDYAYDQASARLRRVK